ncbi:MAG: hypothetical protein AB1806_01280 [Acidobacteriota bacterium]
MHWMRATAIATGLLAVLAGPCPSQSAGTAVAQADRDDSVGLLIDAWERMWNTYDLNQVAELFVPNSSVTYFSSEAKGVIPGIDALRVHHEALGFVPGGKEQPNKLWLEDRGIRWHGGVATVVAIWLFSKQTGEHSSTLQQGPVTFVVVPWGTTYRIAHAHFATYRGPDSASETAHVRPAAGGQGGRAGLVGPDTTR